MLQLVRKKLAHRLLVWSLRHAQMALASLGRIAGSPLSSLMTSAVIGIALALPLGLHVMLNNLQTVTGGWESGASISLFLSQEIDDDQAAELAEKLRAHQRIEQIQVIAKSGALAEFRELSGFGQALDALDENPLPALLVIQPKAEYSSPDSAERLVSELKLLPEADIVQLDMQWVRRLQAITQIAQRAILVLASLLGLAVLLIVGNTIRLEIQNRQTEIEVHKLIGATDAFIRRPFLYIGVWYGLFGGIIAWILVLVSIGLLKGPVSRLASLYQSAFDLTSLDLSMVFSILIISSLLGLMGSWLAVGRHLSAIKPS